MIQPPTTGLIIAASAEQVFIIPLAVPEYLGAMSIGMAHIGPMVISAKKNPRLKQTAATVTSCTKRIGSNEASVARLQTTTMVLRALVRFPVLCNNQSVSHPPSQSPTTPAKNTPDANTAEFFRFIW